MTLESGMHFPSTTSERYLLYFIWPLGLSCHGNTLVSTSHIGCALCVWNIQTGELLRRYSHAEEENVVEMLPNGKDVTGMVSLEQLNAYLCLTSIMNVGAFPMNSRQRDMANSIRRRERSLH